MSHDKIVGFCEPNKCKVEVDSKVNTDAVAARVTAIEQVVSAEGSVTAGTVNTNEIFVTRIYVPGETSYSGDVLYAEVPSQSVSATTSTEGQTVTSSTITIKGYVKKSLSYPLKISNGMYIYDESCISENIPLSPTLTVTVTGAYKSLYGGNASRGYVYWYKNGSEVGNQQIAHSGSVSTSFTVTPGDTIYAKAVANDYGAPYVTLNVTPLDPIYVVGV